MSNITNNGLRTYNNRSHIVSINGWRLPYAPSKIQLTIGSNNTTVSLIDGSEINILKNPKLTEIAFDVELPHTTYPFAEDTGYTQEDYLGLFEYLMVNKYNFMLVITRHNSFRTKMWVSLEGYTITENADNGKDIVVSLKFKQYVNYKTVTKTVTNNTQSKVPPVTKPSTSTSTDSGKKQKVHTVKKGDTLWGISKKYYGNGSYWENIYNANKTVIENTAKKYGKSSSSKGHWIYPGTKLTIPNIGK
jgi:hypothetical protein